MWTGWGIDVIRDIFTFFINCFPGLFQDWGFCFTPVGKMVKSSDLGSEDSASSSLARGTMIIYPHDEIGRRVGLKTRILPVRIRLGVQRWVWRNKTQHGSGKGTKHVRLPDKSVQDGISCHPPEWKVGRVVDGTCLENRRTSVPWVRIPHLPLGELSERSIVTLC